MTFAHEHAAPEPELGPDAGPAPAPDAFLGAGNAAVARALSAHRHGAQPDRSSPLDPAALSVHRHGAQPDGSGPLDPAVGAAIDAARAGGSPLPAVLRSEMEAGLGADLSAVRIHTGERADELSRSVQAHAFTTGADVFFSRGAYDPSSRAGRELIAHELTHVVQQSAGAAGPGGVVSRPSDPHEVEARAVAARIVSGASDPAPVEAGPAVVARSSATGVHRHSSWEHAMLGDASPGELAAAVDSGLPASAGRIHVLLAEHDRAYHMRWNPAEQNPRKLFPDVHWIRLTGSGLWVSYGELNALADYLPNPDTIDRLTASELTPVLTGMRAQIDDDCRAVLGLATRALHDTTLGDVLELLGVTSDTEALGRDNATGLLTRNACHFAPDSWQRWSLYHQQARKAATEHHALVSSYGAMVSDRVQRLEHEAWTANGYGDHFLQDSFAAGHLVNKTLVMQWFAEYLAALPPGVVGSAGMPGRDTLLAMSDPEHTGHGQAGIGHRSLYAGPDLGSTSSQDRTSGQGVTDPQSAQERGSRAARIAGAGVQAEGGASAERRYEQYGEFLDSAFIQQVTGQVHDHFNSEGLLVTNRRGDGFRVGGDDTLLTRSSARGAELAARASELSRTAISELLAGGSTSITPESILAYVPSAIVAGNRTVGLEQWNDTTVRDLCFREIFPSHIATLSGLLVRLTSPTMTPTGPIH